MVRSDLEAPITGASCQVRRAARFPSRRTRVLRAAARGSGAMGRWGAWGYHLLAAVHRRSARARPTTAQWACRPDVAAGVIVVQAKYGSAVPADKGRRAPQHYAVRGLPARQRAREHAAGNVETMSPPPLVRAVRGRSRVSTRVSIRDGAARSALDRCPVMTCVSGVPVLVWCFRRSLPWSASP